MNDIFTIRAMAAAQRYQQFTSILRGQADIALRRGIIDANVRHAAFTNGLDAARNYVFTEITHLTDDTADMVYSGANTALADLGATATVDTTENADFVHAATVYATRIMAAQAERDVMAMANHINSTASRVDLYIRSGKYDLKTATSAVMLEDAPVTSFKFIDRLGRQFKSSKHIRDIYRQHILHTFNEAYMFAAVSNGVTQLQVAHPDPGHPWAGESIAITPEGAPAPNYYDIRDEVFHPSSSATLTMTGSSDVYA